MKLNLHWPALLTFSRWHVAGLVTSADEVPERLARNSATIVWDAGVPKWIVFDCPCRTGHRIMLNADRRRRPFWKIDLQSLDRLTVSPSIDAFGGDGRCHFFIRNGRIIWT